MGAFQSRQTSAVLDLISSTVVNAQGVCIAAAENRILLSGDTVQNNVNIEGLNIDQFASVDEDCKLDVSVDTASEIPELVVQLVKLIQGARDARGNKQRFIQHITKAVNTSVVNECLARAENDFQTAFKQVRGDVNVLHLNLDQMSRARMDKCVMSVDVKVEDGRSLTKFLDDELDKYHINEDVLAKPCGVPTMANPQTGPIALGVMAAIAAVFVVLTAISRHERKGVPAAGK